MPDNAIVKVPEVVSLARPVSKLLLAARTLIQETPEIQAVFKRSMSESWPVEQLSMNLEEPLQGQLDTKDPQEVVEVARYLADEYQQIGDTMLLVSRETGRAIGRISDEQLWTPPSVPREDGSIAQPLPRLRPELEAGLILYHFEKAQDAQFLAEIGPTLHPTELVRQQGDPRLLPLTRDGRSEIVDQLEHRLASLLGLTSGSVAHFLSHFEIREDDPPHFRGQALSPSTAEARVVTGIQDPKAMNLRFPRLGNLAGRVANSWGREVAWSLAVAARQHFQPVSKPYTALSQDDMRGVQTWVGDPDTLTALGKGVFPDRRIALPVDNAPTMGLRGRVGVLVIRPDSYKCAGREIFARWEVQAKFQYTLWVDWDEVCSFELDHVPRTATAVVTAAAR